MRTMNSSLALVGAVALAGSMLLTASASATPAGGLTLLTKDAVSGGIPLTQTDFTSPPGTPGVLTLAFPKFDPSLGHLTSMTLTLSGSMTTTLTLKNLGTAADQAKARTELSLVVQDAGNHLTAGGSPADSLPLVVGFVPVNPQIYLEAGFTKYQTLTAGQTKSFGPYTSSTDPSDPGETYTSPLVLSEFTGTGAYTLNVFAKAVTDLTTGGNFSASQLTEASVTGTVTYEYSSVPEATTMILGGMAVMPILMQRRRQRGTVAQA